MRVFLVQHGDAVPKEVDPERPLSGRGQRDVEQLKLCLAKRKVTVVRILHSGKTRARQTAEILRPLANSTGRIEEQEGLAPNDSPEAFIEHLGAAGEDAIAVSHMPFVSRAVSHALTGAPDQLLLEFRPGSVAGLELGADASWRLFMFVRPEQT